MLNLLLLKFRIKLYPFWHRLFCRYNGGLEILVPTPEYMNETGDTEVYMLCPECNKKYHLINITPD